jgi:hypothetical protein
MDDSILDAGNAQFARVGQFEGMQQHDFGCGGQLPAEADGLCGRRREVHRNQQAAVGFVRWLLDHQHRSLERLAQQARGGGSEQGMAQERLAARTDDQQVGIERIGLIGDDLQGGSGNDAGIGCHAAVVRRVG